MSTRLPYFQFRPTEWITGDISYEDPAVQGAFIQACAHYWNRGCDIAWQTLCDRIRIAYDTLSDSQKEAFATYVHDVEGMASIPFLDEQWSDLNDKAKTRSNAGKAGAAARWAKTSRNATAMRPQCDRNATASESQCDRNANAMAMKKEEGRRKSNNPLTPFDFRRHFLDQGVDGQVIDDWLQVRKKKRAANTKTAAEQFCASAQKASVPVGDAVRIAAALSWAGYYDGITEKYRGKGKKHNRPTGEGPKSRFQNEKA